MTSGAGRSGSVRSSGRRSGGLSRRSGRSGSTHTARTTPPRRKRAATRQLRRRTTSSWPWRMRAPRWHGSASTRAGVRRSPYSRGRPGRRRRGARGGVWRARSRRTRPITAWPSARVRRIGRPRMDQASSGTRTRPGRRPSRRGRRRALSSLPRSAPRRTRRSIGGTAPTSEPRSTTAARHSRPWPRGKDGRFGSAVWSWWTIEPGARGERRSTTLCRRPRHAGPRARTRPSTPRAGRARPAAGTSGRAPGTRSRWSSGATRRRRGWRRRHGRSRSPRRPPPVRGSG